jgi:hypothetical protein
MLREVVSSRGRHLASLDPSRDPSAERRWRHLIRDVAINDPSLRTSHGQISERFRHGDHAGQRVQDLVDQLLQGRCVPSSLPALLAVEWHNALYVICGNRRCHAVKQFSAQRASHLNTNNLSVRVIVHEFPACPSIDDENLKLAFILKSIEAMSTTSGGTRVAYHQTRRHV